MASTQVNPTRMELTKQKKKLVTAVRGHKLLKDKRDELMRQFLDLVRENMELRKKVEAGIRSANTNFVIAKAGMSEETLNTALMAPKQEVYLETGKKNVMSGEIRPVDGGGDRKDPPPGERSGVRGDPKHPGRHPVYHHEAG